MAPKNPIEKELEKLDAQWEAFLDSERPILRWCIDAEASQLVSGFVNIREQFTDDSSDFFVSLESGFADKDKYGFDLARELNDKIAAGIAEAEKEGEVDFSWQALDLRTAKSGYDALLKNCRAILQAFGEFFHNLVIVIRPQAVSNNRQYLAWLKQACVIHRDVAAWPKNLKWLILDNKSNPYFERLARDYPKQIFSLTPPLDLRGAINKVLQNADDGSAGAKFRQSFVDINYAVQNNDIPELEKKSQQAIVIAAENRWHDMLVSVLLARACGYLNAKSTQKALQDYREAQHYAESGVQQQRPGCDKLLYQAHMSEGSAWLTEKQYEQAAKAFHKSAQIAAQQGEAMMSMDSWRLESYCFERMHKKGPAWISAVRGLEAARKIAKEQRPHSTMPYLGEALLRLAPNKEQKQKALRDMTELLGASWRELTRNAAVS